MYLCHTSWPNQKRYRPEICYTYSYTPYLKTGFGFFEKMTLRAASLEKLPCHRKSLRLPCFKYIHILINISIFINKLIGERILLVHTAPFFLQETAHFTKQILYDFVKQNKKQKRFFIVKKHFPS